MMTRSKVTAKYQVTIPKDVREKTGVKPGEVVAVEAVSEEEIRLKRFAGLADPLKVLIGQRRSKKAVPVSELEERIES